MTPRRYASSLPRLVLPLLFALCMATGGDLSAQAPPPPPDTGSKGDDTNKGPGGGASLEGGLVMTLAMAAAYAMWKLRFSGKKE